MKKLSTNEFIIRALKKHNGIYNYSKSIYISIHSKITIICSKHGEFQQTPSNHLDGRGCVKCAIEKQKNTTHDFILKSKKTHGEKYNYSKSIYISNKNPIIITCPIHGDFKQVPNYHMCGNGCQKCAGKYRMNIEDFIKEANKVHDSYYDYSESKYLSTDKPIKVICPIHGSFFPTPKNHINLATKCPECGNNIKLEKLKERRLTEKEFLQRVHNIHGNKYDYSKVKYINYDTKVIIICKKHGDFMITPDGHIGGNGCKKCNTSKSEEKIMRFLEKHNIKYEHHKHFKGCVDKKALYYDFYIPEQNLCIEYDGIQHFHPVEKFGGEKNLLGTQKRDLIKDDFCKKNNINLLRISYKENIINKLKKTLKQIRNET